MDSDTLPIGQASPITDEEFMMRVLAITEEGTSHSKKALEHLTETKVLLAEVANKVTEALSDKIESDKALRTASAMLRNRLAAKQPTGNGGSGIVKLTATILAVGVVSLSVGAARPLHSEARPVHSPADFMTAGRLALAAHDWSAAFTNYESVYDAGLNEEECLAKMAECKLRLKDYKLAAWYANQLTQETRGRSWMALRLRGLIAEATGDREEAVRFFKAAEAAGDDKAGVLHRRLK